MHGLLADFNFLFPNTYSQDSVGQAQYSKILGLNLWMVPDCLWCAPAGVQSPSQLSMIEQALAQIVIDSSVH